MGIDHLVKMANEIGAFFVTANDEEASVRLIADHLRRFWDPRMRKQIVAYWQQGGGGLQPTASKAVGLLLEGEGRTQG